MRTGRSKLDFVEKLQFMQRMIDECLDRLLFQSSYLAATWYARWELVMSWRRKGLYVPQMGEVEYAEGRREQSECLMKGLSFYCLVDMMLVS